MGESHAFGQSLCFSRRHFVLFVCVAMSILCATRVLHWIIVTLSSVGAEQRPAACVGEECFETFTCNGLKDTTAHVMEPLFSLSGLLFFPMGFHAAHHGDDLQMKRFAIFLMFATALRIGVLLFDVLFMHVCEMYDSQVMSFLLTPPLSPLRVGVQEKLRGFSSFPVQMVNAMAGDVHVFAWYLGLSLLWIFFFIYVIHQAIQLSTLMQYGLLGLGVHYGLDQWDEELNRTAIRRKVQRGLHSQFMDDAYLPLSQGRHVGGLPSYGSHGAGYGAAYGEAYAKDVDPVLFEAEVQEEEDEAEVVRRLAEKLANEESPEAMLDRSFD